MSNYYKEILETLKGSYEYQEFMEMFKKRFETHIHVNMVEDEEINFSDISKAFSELVFGIIEGKTLDEITKKINFLDVSLSRTMIITLMEFIELEELEQGKLQNKTNGED